jgi:hypothetical protein
MGLLDGIISIEQSLIIQVVTVKEWVTWCINNFDIFDRFCCSLISSIFHLFFCLGPVLGFVDVVQHGGAIGGG